MLVALFKEYGFGWGMLATLLLLGVMFGIACGCGAIFMCIWNYAVVAAVTVFAEIGFWQAVCMVILPMFIFTGAGIKASTTSKN